MILKTELLQDKHGAQVSCSIEGCVPVWVKLSSPFLWGSTLGSVWPHHFGEAGKPSLFRFSDETTLSSKEWLSQMEMAVPQKPNIRADDSTHQNSPPSQHLTQLSSYQLCFTETMTLQLVQIVCNCRNQKWVLQDTGQHMKDILVLSSCVADSPVLVRSLWLQHCTAFHTRQRYQ